MKKYLLLLVLYILSSPAFIYSQERNSGKPEHTMQQNINDRQPDDHLLLEAGFVAFVTFGQPPLTVQFKDLSTGSPETWNWKFGDGTESNHQHPIHVYEQSGSYTVKLTVSSGGNSNTVSKSGYIVVIPGGICDSLGYPLQGEYALYRIFEIGSGYLSGNNSYGDLAKASYFSGFEEGSQLVAGVFDFAVATNNLTSNRNITFKVWDNNGSFNAPGTILDSVMLPISEIVLNTHWNQSTVVVFEPPLSLEGTFYLGVDLPQGYGDTLALYTNTEGDVIVGNGWEQHNNGDWYPYSDEQHSWALDIDHAVFPVICRSLSADNKFLYEDILVYPNPAANGLNIFFTKDPDPGCEILISDVTGRDIFRKLCSDKIVSVNTSALNNGMYVLTIIKSDGAPAYKKLIIEH